MTYAQSKDGGIELEECRYGGCTLSLSIYIYTRYVHILYIYISPQQNMIRRCSIYVRITMYIMIFIFGLLRLISYYHTCCVNAVDQTSTCLLQDLLSRSPKAMTAAGHDDSSPVEDGPEEMAEAPSKTGNARSCQSWSGDIFDTPATSCSFWGCISSVTRMKHLTDLVITCWISGSRCKRLSASRVSTARRQLSCNDLRTL